MSYDSRKIRRDQEFVEEVEIILDACKYSVGEFWDRRELVAQQFVSGTQGAYVLVSGVPGWQDTWLTATGPIYIDNKGETILVEIDPDYPDHIVFISREMRGSEREIIYIGDKLYLMHQGEAEESCRGFAQTCSTPDSYDPSAKRSLKFSTGQMAGGVFRFSGLRHGSCRRTSGELDPGETVGSRARLSVKISDQRHDDYGVVPYQNLRSKEGTMFGKLIARNPYFQGREIIYREGLRDAGSFAAPDFIERRYIIDSVQLSGDEFTISALDPLILTEDKKAKMPVASPARLSAAITGTPSTFNYIDAPDFYFGPNGSIRWVRIDEEVIRVQVTGANQLTVLDRRYRSSMKDHDEGASIQDCIRLSGTNGVDAIVFAINNYTKVESKYIGDYSGTAALLPSFVFDEALITKPIAVIDFINMIIRLGDLEMYFDEEIQKIAINYTPESAIEPIIIDGREHLERDSIRVDQNIKEQYTRHSHLWAPVDVTKESEENYAIRYLQINHALESDSAMGEVNEKKAFSDPLLTTSPGDSLIGTAYVNRLLSQTVTPPKIVTAKLKSDFVGATQGGNLGVGSIVSLATQESQDVDGIRLSELYRVVRLNGNAYSDYDVKFKRYVATLPPVIDYTISTSQENFDLSSVFAPSAGEYVVYIAPEVVIGSTHFMNPAFTTGSQAAGVSIKLINRGQILGMGGFGGDAGLPPDAVVEAPTNGGDAINATVPLTIDTASGLIWAGGGGGRGQRYIFPQGPNGIPIPRSGGGGGQGYARAPGGRGTNGVSYITVADAGNQSSPGLTQFNGGDGGYWGEDGQGTDGAAGGRGGISIKTNGNSVTIISGNNEFNIRGRIE